MFNWFHRRASGSKIIALFSEFNPTHSATTCAAFHFTAYFPLPCPKWKCCEFTSAVFLLSLYFPFLLILITFLLQLNLAPIPKYLATGMRQCYCADFSPRELAGFYAELSPRLCLFGQSRGEVFFFRVSSDGELLEQERYRKKLSRAKEAVARNNKRNGACVCVLYIYVEITDIAF